MDDHIQEFLDRTKAAAGTMGAVAGATVRFAGKKTGEAVGVARLNLQVLELERRTRTLLEEIGRAVYEQLETGESRHQVLDGLMEELEELYAAIQARKEEAAVLRDAKKCPACGTTCGRQDRYCRHCGAAL